MSLQNTGRFEANFFNPNDVFSGKPHPVMEVFGDEQLPEKISRYENSEVPTLRAFKAVFISNPFRYGVEFGQICVSRRFLNDCYPEVVDDESAGSDSLVLVHLSADTPAEIVSRTFHLLPRNLWTEFSIYVPSIDADRSLEYQAALKKVVPALYFLVSLEVVRRG